MPPPGDFGRCLACYGGMSSFGAAAPTAAPTSAANWPMRRRRRRIAVSGLGECAAFRTRPGANRADITDALRRAFASGAATVYLPYGRYTIHAAIDVPRDGAADRRHERLDHRASGARAGLRPRRAACCASPQPAQPLIVERLAFDMTDLGDQLAVEVAAPRDVVLRDIVTAGTSLLDRKPAGGRVFIEDVCCGALNIAGPAPVIARQLDTEGGETRILNDGGNLTVLGSEDRGRLHRAGQPRRRAQPHSGRSALHRRRRRSRDPRVPRFRRRPAAPRSSRNCCARAATTRSTSRAPAATIRAAEFPPRAATAGSCPGYSSGAAAGR